MKSWTYPLYIALTLSGVWLMLNTALPIWDGADFVISAQNNANVIKTGSVWEAVRSLYFDRGWRPLIWSSMASPFFYIFSNQTVLALTALQTLTIGVFLYYLHEITRIYQPSKAAYVTSIIFLFPWLFNISRDFYPDFLLLTASLPVMHYYLIEQVTKGTPTTYNQVLIPIFVCFLFGSRPVEASIYVTILFLCIVAFDFRTFLKSFLPVVSSGSLFLVFIVVVPLAKKFGMIGHVSGQWYLFFGGLAASAVLVCHDIYRKKGCDFFSLFSMGLLLVSIWYVGLAHQLIDWAYTTSFGDLAKQTDRRFAAKSFIDIVWDLGKPVGQKLTVSILALSFGCLLFSLISRRVSPQLLLKLPDNIGL